MEAVAQAHRRLPQVAALRLDPAAAAAWAVPLVLVLYLALNNGGYDVAERSEVGIAVWWIVLVGTVVGALPVAGGTRAGRLMLVLLAAFAGWTALSLAWTESSERTATELGRTATYLGVFALALSLQGEGRWRHLLHGATAGVAIVCGIAVLSRLEPTWFPERVTGRFLPGIDIERRLAYPLNYSSGLGAFAGLALPLLLGATSSARTLVGQALACAALPVVALTLWLTTSSLSVPVAVIGLLVFIVLAPDRLPKIGSLSLAALGSSILFAALEQRDALDRGLPTPTAQSEGDEMLAMVIVVCSGVALAQMAIGLTVRYGRRPRWLLVPRPQAAVATALALVAALVVAVGAGVPGELSDRWEEFKERGEQTSPIEGGRGSLILDVSSSGRYDFWESAADANATEPWLGIGPGTFEFWWSREGLYAGFVRDAHSLYMETLAELGIIGLLLIGGFSAAVLMTGTVRALRAPAELRLGLAMATAGCAAFCAAAWVDWTWELGTLPVLFMALAAVAIAGGDGATSPRRGPRPRVTRPRGRGLTMLRGQLAWRAGLAVLSIAAMVAIAVPFAATSAIEDSRAAAREGRLGTALREARDAVAVQPYAATPRLQEALVLERQGELDAAARAAREATSKESTNWRTWLILSRLEARRQNSEAALSAYREGRALNPRSGALAP
jgi:hypothetical protein